MVMLITYDLNKPGQGYADLYKAIKEVSGTWWHHLTSVWLIETSLTVQQVAARLRQHIDKNDQLLVVRIQQDFDGYLPQDAWSWLNSRFGL